MISSCQYGFRKNYSISHLLVQAVHDWAETLIIVAVLTVYFLILQKRLMVFLINIFC